MADIGKQWSKQLFTATLDSKLDFDGKVKTNLLGLAADVLMHSGKCLIVLDYPQIGSLFEGLGGSGANSSVASSFSGSQTNSGTSNGNSTLNQVVNGGGKLLDLGRSIFGGGSFASGGGSGFGVLAGGAGGATSLDFVLVFQVV